MKMKKHKCHRLAALTLELEHCQVERLLTRAHNTGMASFLCVWNKLKFVVQFVVIPQRRCLHPSSHTTEDWADTGDSTFDIQVVKLQTFRFSCGMVLGFNSESP